PNSQRRLFRARRRSGETGTSMAVRRLAGWATAIIHLLRDRLRFVSDLAVEQRDSTLGVTSVALIVCYQAYRGAFGMKFAEQSHDGIAVLGIEIARRFVGEKD